MSPSCCLFVAAYLSTVVLDGAPVPRHTGLLALLAIRLVFGPVPGDWAVRAVGGGRRAGGRGAISALGAFDYADPDFAGIPMWLPALWANGGLLIRRLFVPVVYAAIAQQHEPAERAHVGGAVGAERDRRVVVVEAEPGAGEPLVDGRRPCGSRSP